MLLLEIFKFIGVIILYGLWWVFLPLFMMAGVGLLGDMEVVSGGFWFKTLAIVGYLLGAICWLASLLAKNGLEKGVYIGLTVVLLLVSFLSIPIREVILEDKKKKDEDKKNKIKTIAIDIAESHRTIDSFINKNRY